MGASPRSASVRERAARVAAPAFGELSALLLTSVKVVLRAVSPRTAAPPAARPGTSMERRSRLGTDCNARPTAMGCELNSFDGVTGRSAARTASSIVKYTPHVLLSEGIAIAVSAEVSKAKGVTKSDQGSLAWVIGLACFCIHA